MPKITQVQVYDRKDGETGVRMVGGNGEKLNTSEGYSSPSYARKVGKEWADKLGAKFVDKTK